MNMDSGSRKRQDRGRRGRGRGYGRQHKAQGGRYNHGGSNRSGGKGRERRGKREQPLGNNVLEEMADQEPHETLHRLSACRDNLRRIVQARDVRFCLMIHLVGALSNACRCDTSQETLVEILSILQRESFVADHLMQFIQECQMPNMDIMYPYYVEMLPSLLSSVVTILSSFLPNLPDSVYDVDEAIRCLHFSMRMAYAHELSDDLFDAVEELQDLSEDVMDKVDQWGSNDPRWVRNEPVPEDDFRDLPIFPMVEELQKDDDPFLRKNIVDRGYDSVDHYLDIQFRLLREDLVAPLREGIAEFRAHRRSNSNQKHVKLQDIYVYHDVRVLEAKPEHDGIVHVTTFNVKLLSKVQWERSKRLVFGSLVCLSTDNFATATFAVVNGSDRRGLSRGKVELRFHQDSKTTRLISTTFTMVESSAYFEAYRHVLKRLQCITQATFPLKAYIVDTSPEIRLPEYLRQNKNALYHLQPVARHNGAQYTRVARPENWPAPANFDLDQSQFEAYKAALTEELCCIQGPPGTGKTFIGLKIVETLLLNKFAWSPDGENHPILLICFTNHALDQFLEGVLAFAPEGIIRIGGRSSSEKLKEFNLKEIRNERSRLKLRPKHQYLQLKVIRNEMRRLANSMHPLHKDIRTANTKVLYDSRLKYFIPTVQWKSLLGGISAEHTAFLGDQCIAYWLGVVETKVGMPTTERQEFRTHKDAAPLLVADYDNLLRGEIRNVCILEGSSLQKYITNGLHAVGQMREMEYLVTSDVWHLGLIDRWRLYNYWVHKHQKYLQRLMELTTGGVLQSHVLREYMSSGHRASLEKYGREHGIADSQLMTSFLGVSGRDIQSMLTLQFQQLTVKDRANRHEVTRAMVENMRHAEVSEIPREMILHVSKCLSQVEIMGYNEAQQVTHVCTLTPHSRWRLYKYWVQLYSDDIKKRLNVSGGEVLREGVLRPHMTPLQLRNLHDVTHNAAIGNINREQLLVVWLKAYSGVPRNNVRDVLNQHPHGNGKIEVRGEAELMEAMRYLDDGDDEELDGVLHGMTGGEEEDEGSFNIRQEPTIRVPHLENREGSNTGKRVSAHLGSVDDMPEDRAHSVKHLWRMSNKDRWMLYGYWVRLFKESTQAKLRPLHDQYEKQARLLKEARLNEDYDIIRGSSVLALTTTGAAKYHDLIKLVNPRIVVVEEAAEVLEAHIVTSLTESCQHLILIGDHQQLRPNPTVYRLEQEYDLHISLFERLVTNKFPKHRLSLQHRMRPEIAELLKVHKDFYPDLRDSDSVKEYADVRGMKTNVYFMNHSHTESGDSETHSKSNEFEAAFLARLCQYFLHQEYLPQQITILTAYAGQLWQFRKHMPKDVFQDVHVCPVDSYQGEENDIILLSFVRSNDRGNIGFLKTANRVCVALSRARKGLYCVGNFSLLSGKTALWRAITDCLHRRGYLGNSMPLRCSNHPEIFTAVNTVQDFMKVLEGGCTKPCEATLECGHICPIKVCHPRNPKHVGIECKEECDKFLCDLEHRCRKLCYEKCDVKCNSFVRVLLPCGHKKKIQCHKRFSTDIKCQEPCNRILRCGHPCKRNCADSCTDLCEVMVACTYRCGHPYSKKCYEESEPTECKVKVPRKLICGHTRMIECSRKSSTGMQCDQLCSKLLKCGHPCRKKCCESCTDKCTTLKTFSFPCGHSYRKPCYGGIDEACKLTIEKPLPCGHIKKVPCYMGATDVECDNPCPKLLTCGHPCTRKCGGSRAVICKVPRTFSYSCGHQYGSLCNERCDGVCKMIVEKTLSCGHRKNLKCYQKTTSVQCDEPCSKILKCGHQCQENCGDICTSTCLQTGSLDALCEHLQHKLCVFIVDRKCRKIIRRKLPCGHTRIIQCHDKNSTDLQCVETCQKLLECGHSCKEKCGETCYCTLVDKKEFLCGHAVEVRCGDTKLECGKPCGKILKCGHTCTGTCRQCRQGRLHIPCVQPCGYTLICGHSCKSVCSAFCPPCDMDVCENACAHRKCRKRCSNPCTPCPERCDSVCEHTSCSRLCWQPCERRPCDQPCRKRLQKCGHPCIGMCGDPCPTLCRVCNRDQFNAFDAVSRFVQLEDCRHLIEVKRLDKWMAMSPDNDECIQVKVCPTCTTPIRRNARYTGAIRETRKDMEYVKTLLGNGNRLLSADIDEKRTKILKELSSEDAETRGASFLSKYTTLLKYRKEPAFDGPTVRRFVRRFREQLNSCSSSSTMAALSLKMEMFKILCGLRRETRRIEDRHEAAREKRVLAWVFEDILQWLDEMKYVSEQSLDDWKDETRRISSMQKLMETRVYLSTAGDSSLNVIMTEIYLILSRRTQRADVTQRSIVDGKFRQLGELVPGLNRRRNETSLSFRNVSGYPSSSDWFKCRYGHYYWSGTAKKGECPECNTGRQFRWRRLLRKDSGSEV